MKPHNPKTAKPVQGIGPLDVGILSAGHRAKY